MINYILQIKKNKHLTRVDLFFAEHAGIYSEYIRAFSLPFSAKVTQLGKESRTVKDLMLSGERMLKSARESVESA